MSHERNVTLSCGCVVDTLQGWIVRFCPSHKDDYEELRDIVF